MRYFAILLFLAVSHVHAADCPTLLDAALPTLSNDFGGQEPGSNREIAKFCEANYGVSFPMFTKTSVAKGSLNPFYEKLTKAAGARPGWNFHKYLVDRRGAKAISFDTRVEPSDPKFIKEIERLLAEKGDSK